MKFSIAISAYKGKFIRECIDSILSQTYKDFELIILNDCSPDNIKEIVNSYNDERIHYYFNEKNVGAYHVVDNWNKCLSYAKGDYYMQMGDDDKLAPNYLEEFNHLINKYPDLNVYHCRSIIIDEESTPFNITDPLPEWESMYSAIYYRLRYRLQFISDFVYNTKHLKDNGGFYKLPLAWASDDITSYIAAFDKGIAHINIPLFYYRSNRYSITSTGDSITKIKVINTVVEWIKKTIDGQNIENDSDTLHIKLINNYLPVYSYLQKTNLLTSEIKRKKIAWLKEYKELQLSPKLIFKSILNIRHHK